MKTKLLALMEIAIVLCSVFLVTIPVPTIAAGQDDDALGIYGNANLDDCIDMRDYTYTARIICWLEDETDLADANYDGRISVADMTQIGLIILGRENELTILDDSYSDRRALTIKKPLERIVVVNSYACEALRTLKSEDKIVGVGGSTAKRNEYFPELSKLPVVGDYDSYDVEEILNLNPDILIVYGGQLFTHYSADLEEKLKGTNVILMRFTFASPDTMSERMTILGYMLDKKNEAEEFIDFFEEIVNTVTKRTEGLSEDKKPKVFIESMGYTCTGATLGRHQMCTMAGGINIAADLPGHLVEVDPEWVLEQNPDIIIWETYYEAVTGYEIDDPSKVEAVREDLINRPAWKEMKAVKNGKFYCMHTMMNSHRYYVGTAYMAKYFQPELFEDLDPKAINEEYLERFQGIPYKGVYVCPEPS